MAKARTLPEFKNVKVAEIEAALNKEFDSLKSGYDTAKANRLKRYREYKFQAYGNEKAGQSKIVDSTIFNAIEWMVPTLIQPFVETPDMIKVLPEGANVKDIITAQVVRELLTYQIRKKSGFYGYLHDTFKSVLIQGEAYTKLTWQKKDKMSGEPVGRPHIAAIPASQIRYDWTVRNFEDSKVVTQEEDMTRSDILRLMSGAKGLLEEEFRLALEEVGAQNKEARLRDEVTDQPGWVGERSDGRTKDQSLYVRREHWTEYDMDGSGKAIPILAVFINGRLVQVIKNPYKFQRPPFLASECVRDPLGNPSTGWAEVLSDIQKFKTAILRMTSDNLNSQQNGLYEVDRTNVDDVGFTLLQRAPAGTRVGIPVRKPGSINNINPVPIAKHAFTTWEMLDVAAENRSGFTRYSQGLDSTSLNQTATGIVTITQRSEMRMWEIAFRYAEMTFKPMARMLIALNQQFLEPQDLELQFGLPAFEAGDIPARPAGEWITLSKEDLGGYFSVDIDIDVGVDRNQKIKDIQNWLAVAAPFQDQVDSSLITTALVQLAKAIRLPQVEAIARRNADYVGNRGVGVARTLFQPGGTGAAASGVPGAGAGPNTPGSTGGLPQTDPRGVSGGDLLPPG